MLFTTNMPNKLITISLLVLMLVSCTHDDGYRVEGNKVVFENPWNEGFGTVITTLDVDPNSFQILGNDKLNWAKDKDKVFWRAIDFDFMDPDSFEILSMSLAKDKNHVICGKNIMKEANPKDFKIRTFIDKDNEVYIYGVDKHAAYICSRYPTSYRRLSSQSIDSFEKLEDGFYKDNDEVWWSSKVLPTSVNVPLFNVLKKGYATDGNNIYYHWRIVNGADPKTFKVTGSMYAQDKNYRYEMEDNIGSVKK